MHARTTFDEPLPFLKTETSTSAGWNSNPGVPSTVPGGQQQLATQASAQVVSPVQSSYPSAQASFKPEDNSYTNTGSAALVAAAPQLSASSYPSTQASLASTEKTSVSTSTTQSAEVNQSSTTSANNAYSNGVNPVSVVLVNQSAGTHNVTAAATSNSTVDSYPVYYVSNSEEPSAQQQSSQTSSNAKLHSSVSSSPSLYAASQGGNNDGYPVYYVGFEEVKYNTSEAKITSNTTSVPAPPSVNTSINNQTNKYPVYYVTSYNKETPNASMVTNSNSSTVSGNKSSYEHTHVDSVPVYNVGGPEAMATDNVSKTKAVPNSPISYKIINSTSASLDVSLSGGSRSPAPLSAAAPATVNSAPHTPAFQPAPQPATTSYNYPSNKTPPAPYQTAAPPSTYQQAYNYYGYPASPQSPATYQANGSPSPAAYSAPSPALQPITTNNGYPANQTFSSSAQSSVPQPVVSSYQAAAPAAAPAPVAAPAPSPAPAPASAPASGVISGVSSSPPFPPASESTTPTHESKTSSSSIGGNENSHTSSPAHDEYPSFPKLDPAYENASYIIASPPEKDTVLFLPPPSFPLSPDAVQDGKSKPSVVSNSSSQQINATSVLNASPPELPVSFHPESIKTPSVISNQTTTSTENSAVLPPALNTTDTEEDMTESPIIRIPENITLPGWELENSTFNNITFMPSSPLEPPSTTPAPAVPTTPTAPPAPASSNKTVSNDLLNIPLGPLLDSLAVTTPPQTTKPPQPQLFTTPPPKPAPAPGTKPPPVAFQPTSKPTEMAKEWGFGDKYLGMKRGVCYCLTFTFNS